ncbi:VOC family protein [Actinomadura nitritigenes]|uniref:VOC family protein n=1 Tax=Actinomadura nitritigenes TaxID=134602 RepID=UPI003D8DBB08
MPEVDHRPQGMPIWGELDTPDVEQAKAFYGRLFGWCSYAMTLDTLGEYEIFTREVPLGPGIAGVQPLSERASPPSWICYFRTTDLAASIAAINASGGEELVGMRQVGLLGQHGLFTDPEGARFGLWEPFEHQHSALIDEPSTMCWMELACHDPRQARRFYELVFGWRTVDNDDEGFIDAKIGTRSVASMVEIGERWPPRWRSQWVPYFEVADCDSSTTLAADLGAHVHIPPANIASGRFALITDPAGARLALLAPDRRYRRLWQRDHTKPHPTV